MKYKEIYNLTLKHSQSLVVERLGYFDRSENVIDT